MRQLHWPHGLADKTPQSSLFAQRRAMVLRVKDRGRFERVVERFQNASGNFT